MLVRLGVRVVEELHLITGERRPRLVGIFRIERHGADADAAVAARLFVVSRGVIRYSTCSVKSANSCLV